MPRLGTFLNAGAFSPWISSTILRGNENNEQKVAIILRDLVHQVPDGYVTTTLTDKVVSITARFSSKVLAAAFEEAEIRGGNYRKRRLTGWSLVLRQFEIQHYPSLLNAVGEFVLVVKDCCILNSLNSLPIGGIVSCMTVPAVLALAQVKMKEIETRNVNLRSRGSQRENTVGSQQLSNTVGSHGGDSQSQQLSNLLDNLSEVTSPDNDKSYSVYTRNRQIDRLSGELVRLRKDCSSLNKHGGSSQDIIPNQVSQSDSSVSVSDLCNNISVESQSGVSQPVPGVERQTGVVGMAAVLQTGAVGMAWRVPHNNSQCPFTGSTGPSSAAMKSLSNRCFGRLMDNLRKPFTLSEFTIPETQQEMLDQIKDDSSPSQASPLEAADASESSFNIGSENTLLSQPRMVLRTRRNVNKKSSDDGQRSKPIQGKNRADAEDGSGGQRTCEGGSCEPIPSSNHSDRSYSLLQGQTFGSPNEGNSLMLEMGSPKSHSTQTDSQASQTSNGEIVEVTDALGNESILASNMGTHSSSQMLKSGMCMDVERTADFGKITSVVPETPGHSDDTGVSNEVISENRNVTATSMGNFIEGTDDQLNDLPQEKKGGTVLSKSNSNINCKLKDQGHVENKDIHIADRSSVENHNAHVRKVLQSEHDRLVDLCSPEYPSPATVRPAVGDKLHQSDAMQEKVTDGDPNTTVATHCVSVADTAASLSERPVVEDDVGMMSPHSDILCVRKDPCSSTENSKCSKPGRFTQTPLYQEKRNPAARKGDNTQKKSYNLKKKSDNSQKKIDAVQKKSDKTLKKSDNAQKKSDNTQKKSDNVGKMVGDAELKRNNVNMLIKTSRDDTINDYERVALQTDKTKTNPETNPNIPSNNKNKVQNKDQKYLSSKSGTMQIVEPSWNLKANQVDVARTEECNYSQTTENNYPDSETTNGWESDSVQLIESQDRLLDMTDLDGINNYNIDRLNRCEDQNAHVIDETITKNKQSQPEDSTKNGDKVSVQDRPLQLENTEESTVKNYSGDTSGATSEVLEKSKTDSRLNLTLKTMTAEVSSSDTKKLTLKIKTADVSSSDSRKLTFKKPIEFDSDKRCKQKSKELRKKVLAARERDSMLTSNKTVDLEGMEEQFNLVEETLVAHKLETNDLANEDLNANSEEPACSKEMVKVKPCDNSVNSIMSHPQTRSNSSVAAKYSQKRTQGCQKSVRLLPSVDMSCQTRKKSTVAVKNTQKKYQGCQKMIVLLGDIAKQQQKGSGTIQQSSTRVVDSPGRADNRNGNKEAGDGTELCVSEMEQTEICSEVEQASKVIEIDAKDMSGKVDANICTETNGIVNDHSRTMKNSADSNVDFSTQPFNPQDETQRFSPELFRTQSQSLDHSGQQASPTDIPKNTSVSLNNISLPTCVESLGVDSRVCTISSEKSLSNDTVHKPKTSKDDCSTDRNSACIDNLKESNKGVVPLVNNNVGDTENRVPRSLRRVGKSYACKETQSSSERGVINGKETKLVSASKCANCQQQGEEQNSRTLTHDKVEDDVDTCKQHCDSRYENACEINKMKDVTKKRQTNSSKQKDQATDKGRPIAMDSTFVGTSSIPVEDRDCGATETDKSDETAEKDLNRVELELKFSQSSEEYTQDSANDATSDVSQKSNSIRFIDKFNLRGFKNTGRKRKNVDRDLEERIILKGMKKRKKMSVQDKRDLGAEPDTKMQSRSEVLHSPKTKPVCGELVRKQKDGVYKFVRLSKQNRVKESEQGNILEPKQGCSGEHKQSGFRELKRDCPVDEAEDSTEDEDESPSLISGVRRKKDGNIHDGTEIVDYSLPSYQPVTSSAAQSFKGNNSFEEEDKSSIEDMEDNSVIVISSGESSKSLSASDIYWRNFLTVLKPDLSTEAGRKLEAVRKTYAFK